ncbi:glycosyltransferase family 2 protein, partial [Enterococcus sp. RTP31106st1_D7_RTP31106_210429]
MVAVPLLSFVVIAYNVQPYIIQCLQSVKAQTLDDFEVIVVDDASTDGTLECITREVADDQRFHIIAKSENEGAHLARRTGALATKGQYVYFVDGDDSISALLCEQVSMLTRA